MMKDVNMDITVTGMVGRRGDKQKLVEAAQFFAAQLMDPRMVRNLTVDIEVRKDLDVEGECVDEDGVRNPRWFTIGLKSQDIDEMIKVLAHRDGPRQAACKERVAEWCDGRCSWWSQDVQSVDGSTLETQGQGMPLL